jgi:hypothetical protein
MPYVYNGNLYHLLNGVEVADEMEPEPSESKNR